MSIWKFRKSRVDYHGKMRYMKTSQIGADYPRPAKAFQTFRKKKTSIQCPFLNPSFNFRLIESITFSKIVGKPLRIKWSKMIFNVKKHKIKTNSWERYFVASFLGKKRKKRVENKNRADCFDLLSQAFLENGKQNMSQTFFVKNKYKNMRSGLPLIFCSKHFWKNNIKGKMGRLKIWIKFIMRVFLLPHFRKHFW